MSRSLHHPRPARHGWDCPFLPTPPHTRADDSDRDCGVRSEDHPGGHCPNRTIDATRVWEGDLIISRDVPPDHARQHHPGTWSAIARQDNRAVRRDVAVRIGRWSGPTDAVVDAYYDDPVPFRGPDRRISWQVC